MGCGREFGLGDAHKRRKRVQVNPNAVGDYLVGNPGIAHPQRRGIRQRQPLQGLGPAGVGGH